MSHSAKRIVAQFGTREPVTEYQSKHTGDNRAPQPLADAVFAANDTWVILILYKLRIGISADFGQVQSALASYPILKPPGPQLDPTAVVSALDEHAEDDERNSESSESEHTSSRAGVTVDVEGLSHTDHVVSHSRRPDAFIVTILD